MWTHEIHLSSSEKKESWTTKSGCRSRVTDEELQWIFRVADRNGDGNIGRDEILFALQAWHGYQHMGDFDALFTKSRAPSSFTNAPRKLENTLNTSTTLR